MGSAPDPKEERRAMAAAAAEAADAAVALAEDQVLSKQVLWQKAFIAEMAKLQALPLEPEVSDLALYT